MSTLLYCQAMFRLIVRIALLLLPVLSMGQNSLECSDPLACNYDAASESEQDCQYCGCELDSTLAFTLEVEIFAEGLIDGMTTYRVYLNTTQSTDVVSAVFGSDEEPLSMSTTTGFYNNEFGGITAWSISPFMLGLVPDLAADSWVTIGISDNSTGESISTVESPNQPVDCAVGAGGVILTFE